jgi:peptidoglycan L-alanyl-D-glutamate endopeptidase CwlK
MAVDNITLQRIELLHPAIRNEVRTIYINEVVPALTKVTCRFAYTLRTFAEQDALYAQGRTRLHDAQGRRLGIVTKAKGGQSIHNYGLAFDIVLLVDNDNNGTRESASWDTVRDFDKDGRADWMEVVDIFKKYNYTWGGDWKFRDAPHFEKKGYDWRTLLNKHNQRDFISGTTYVNL